MSLQQEGSKRFPAFVNQMELICELGNGKQGSCLLAKLNESQQRFVLKSFNDVSAMEQEKASLQRLEGVKNVIQLRHLEPGLVVPLKSPGMTIALEYCQHGELYSFVEAGLGEDLAKCVVHQCLTALHNCHLMGVIHRDLKPENIFVGEDHEIQIGDFGLSSIVGGDNSMVDELRGTPSYIAPEVVYWAIEKCPYDGIKADIWSLGCILFVMVTGNSPFGDHGAQPDDWFFKQLKRRRVEKFWAAHERYSLNPITPTIKSLIEKMLSPDPRLRPSIPEILANEWFETLICPEEYRFKMGLLTEEIARKLSKDRASLSHATDSPPSKHQKS